MIKQSEEQSDIIDRLQGTISACSNLHAQPCPTFCGCTLAMSNLGHWPEHGHIRVTEFICVFVSLIPDLTWHPSD
jgi:hypothetical protein